MTPSDPTPHISTSAFRQLLGAASDAGLGNIVAANSVRNDEHHVTITIDARDVRALTNWLLLVGESHRDTPITANTVRGASDVSTEDVSWMRHVTDVNRTTPVGYAAVHIPSRNEGSTQ